MRSEFTNIFLTFFLTLLVSTSLVSAAIKIWIKDPTGTILPNVNGVYMSGCSISGSTETCYYYQSIPCGVTGYRGQVYKDGAYSVWTSLYWSCSCGNNVCESGETQANCPNDCKTVVSISPSRMYAGDKVTATVYFNDSSYISGKNAKIALFIDDKAWTTCQIHDTKWRDMGWGGSSSWKGMHQGSSVEITSTNGYAMIKFDCIIPTDLPQGTHTLKAVPTLYSEEMKLNGGEAEFFVLNGFMKFLGLTLLSIKLIF